MGGEDALAALVGRGPCRKACSEWGPYLCWPISAAASKPALDQAALLLARSGEKLRQELPA